MKISNTPLNYDPFEEEIAPVEAKVSDIPLDYDPFAEGMPLPPAPAAALPSTSRDEYRQLIPQRGLEARLAQSERQTFISKDRKDRESIKAQLQSDIDNDIPVDPVLLAEYQSELKIPEVEKVRTKPMEPEPIPAQEPVQEKPLFSMENLFAGMEELRPRAFGYAPERALGFVAQALDFYPGLTRGAKETARSLWTAIIGEKNTQTIEQLAYKAPVFGDILKRGEKWLTNIGKTNEEVQAFLMQTAMEKGGRVGVAEVALTGSIMQTLMALKALKGLGIGYGTQAGIKSTLVSAGVRAAVMAATQEGLTPKERLGSFAIGLLYQSTPALSGTIGKWTKSDVMAKIADVSANFLITAPQLPSMWDNSYARAEAEGKPDMANYYFFLDAARAVGSDVVFGVMARAFRDKGNFAAEKAVEKAARAANVPITKVGVDTVPFKPLGEVEPVTITKPAIEPIKLEATNATTQREIEKNRIAERARIDAQRKAAEAGRGDRAERGRAELASAAEAARVEPIETKPAEVEPTPEPVRRKQRIARLQDRIAIVSGQEMTLKEFLRSEVGGLKAHAGKDLSEEMYGVRGKGGPVDISLRHKKGAPGGEYGDAAADMAVEAGLLKVEPHETPEQALYRAIRESPTEQDIRLAEQAEEDMGAIMHRRDISEHRAERKARALESWKLRQKMKTGEPVKAESLNVGDEFTIDGERFFVVEEDDTSLRVKDGKEFNVPYETPADKTQMVFMDKGSLKKARIAEKGALFPAEDLSLIGEKVVDTERTQRERDAAAERQATLERQAQELPGIKVPSVAPKVAEITIGQRVQLRGSPQTYIVERELPREAGDQPDERFFDLKNEKTGKIVHATQLAELKAVSAKKVGPGLKGGPGAAAAEGEGELAPQVGIRGGEPEGSITSIRNKQTDIERGQLGLPKAEPVIRRSHPKVHDAVVREMDNDPTVGKRLIEDLRKKTRPLTDREDAILLYEQVQAQAEINRANQDANKALESGDTKAQAEAEARSGVALDRLFDVYQVGRKAGTENARGLAARNMFVDENFNLVSLQLQKKAANGGAPLTRDQLAEVERTKAAYDQTKKALDDLQARYNTIRKQGQQNIVVEKKLRDVKKAHDGIVEKWHKGLKRDQNNPDLWSRAIDEFVAERKTKIPDNDLSRVKEELKQASRINDDNNRDMAVAKALNRLLSYVPLRGGDWFDAYIYTNMLSNPMSHARNTLGNLINAMALRPLGLITRGEFKGAATYTKNLVKPILDGSAWARAMSSFGSGEPAKMVEVLVNLPETASPIARMKRQMEIVKRSRGPENMIGKKAWQTINWVGDFMQAQDQYVRAMIERGETARLVAKGRAPDMAARHAHALASQYLYHDRMGQSDKSLDQVSRTMEHIGIALDGLRRMPGIPGRIFKMAVPFLKTPIKIAQFNTQVSALGFIGANRNRIAKARYKAKSFQAIQDQLASERRKLKPDMEHVDELEAQVEDINQTSGERYGKALVGTALTALGGIMAANSNTIWDAPKDKKARELFYDAGRRRYAFRVGNTWIPMMYLGPGMIAFAVPAAIRDIAIDAPESIDNTVVEKTIKLLLAVPNMLIDQLPLEGVASLMNMVVGKEDYTWKRFVGRFGTQLTPFSGIMQFIKNLVDPTYRRTITIEDTIKAGIPGLSEHVQAIKNSEGLDAKADVWTAFLPYKPGKRNMEKEEEFNERMEMLRERARAKVESKKIAE